MIESLLPKCEVDPTSIHNVPSTARQAARNDDHPVQEHVDLMGRSLGGRRAYHLPGYGWHTIDHELNNLMKEPQT